MVVAATSPPSARQRLGIILGAALVLRLVILTMTAPLDLQIVDEQHYHVLATSLVEGRGLASASGPTSLRPPVYPALVAGLWSITGSRSLQVVRAAQGLLGLATAALVYWIGRRLYDERAGLVAAAITAFYPALVLANSLFLTETVFTFLLTAFVAALVALVQRPRPAVALAAGALLGLSALTRSVVWPFPLVLVPLLAWMAPTTVARRLACCALLVAGFAAVVAPWAVRNTRLQGVPVVVDTMGGMNLRMGNYEFTPHDRIWDAVSQRGTQSWIVGIPPQPPGGGEWTEGSKERWAREQAIAFMRAAPGSHALAGGDQVLGLLGARPRLRGGDPAGAVSPALVGRRCGHSGHDSGVSAGARPGDRRRVPDATGRLAQPPAADPAGPVRHGAAQRGVRPSAIPAAPHAGAGGLRGRCGVRPGVAAAAARAGE